MSLLVKICGLRSRADVATAIDAGADALGFVFAESPRRILPDAAANAAEGIPAHVLRVAVMRHPSNDEWQAVRHGFRPDVLQTDVEDFDDLDVPAEVTRWPVIRERPAQAAAAYAAAFLYEGRHSGRGETVDWQRAAHIATKGDMILAGGLTADNVAEAIRVVRPYGVDVSSGVEAGPGEKDPALIRQFMSAARAAEKIL